MSTLAEVEAAIEDLPTQEFEELALWLERRCLQAALMAPAAGPDFLTRAKAVWGEMPSGKPLSELVLETRD